VSRKRDRLRGDETGQSVFPGRRGDQPVKICIWESEARLEDLRDEHGTAKLQSRTEPARVGHRVAESCRDIINSEVQRQAHRVMLKRVFDAGAKTSKSARCPNVLNTPRGANTVASEANNMKSSLRGELLQSNDQMSTRSKNNLFFFAPATTNRRPYRASHL